MHAAVPEVLARLLAAGDESTRDAAWKLFVAEYSRLLLFVARRTTSDYDSSMDAYAFMLDKLREQDLRRLRGYAADGRGKFTTWLVVVGRRLCLDWHRHRYGRAMDDSSNDDDEARAARRRLVDLVTWNTDRAIATQASDQDPDRELRRSELDRVLDVAMNELAPADRTLLSLRFQDELSAAEIAPLMHFATPFHVYRRINHLLSGLRQRLAQLGVQSPLP